MEIKTHSQLLVFDEATSNVDLITEHAIRETLKSAMINTTVIVIAHRLSAVVHLDRILVLERGRIAEEGTHSELLERRGLYYALWLRQSDSHSDITHEDPARAPHPLANRGWPANRVQ
jgi:ATP-binding cassette, subfamily B, bacterial